VNAIILGSGGGAPSATRETSCLLVRDGERALLLDAGSGARRLLVDEELLQGVAQLDVVLTHFHFDHISGLPLLQWLDLGVTVWGPGEWLYERPTFNILAPLLRPPISANDVSETFAVKELRAEMQLIGDFTIGANAQQRHWAPSVGLRVNDELALITDTPHESSSVALAAGVKHLLHEAWSSAARPRYPEHDATAADAALVAREAGVGDLTLIHLDRKGGDLTLLLEEARAIFPRVRLGEDGLRLA
jgi:ribonuclease BN (tRNA processing enzyme)